MPPESAILILIPEAEKLVGPFRHQYDPAAALGVPAHITVLYPFQPPATLTAPVIENLRALFAQLPRFEATFAEVRQFPNVLYLAPEPAAPFQALTEAVFARFPETPPYGGQFAEVIPHLTVAEVKDAPQFRTIAADFERTAHMALPLQAVIHDVVLMDNVSGFWQIRQWFPLQATVGAHVS